MFSFKSFTANMQLSEEFVKFLLYISVYSSIIDSFDTNQVWKASNFDFVYFLLLLVLVKSCLYKTIPAYLASIVLIIVFFTLHGFYENTKYSL